MDYDIKIKFHEKVIIIKGEKKSLLSNTYNSNKLFLPNDCVEILNNIIDLDYTLEKAFLEFTGEDKDYILEVIKKLIDIDIIVEKDKAFYLDSEDINVSLDITKNCNLRCTHCCIDADFSGDSDKREDLSTESLIKILDKIIRIKPYSITISGGEPLLRKDFAELTKYMRKNYDGVLMLMTNAVLITDDLAELISKNYNQVDVSIDGVDEATCSKIRGAGTFDKIINGIKKLKSKDMNKISGSMVLCKDNISHREDFKDLCKELDINPMLRIFADVGRGKDNKEALKTDMTEKPLSDIEKEEYRKANLLKQQCQSFSCGACERLIQIDYNGDMYPCAALVEDEFLLGNIADIDDFKKFIEKREFAKTTGYQNLIKYFPYNISQCSDCNHSLFCWVCVANIKNSVQKNEYPKCEFSKSFYSLYWE